MSSHDETVHAAGAKGDHVPHVLPLGHYLKVWGALLTLTAITVYVSYFDFGTMNIVVALAVATTKATLVAAIFMHLIYDKKFNAIVLGFSAIFLVILMAFTMADTAHRGMADPMEAARPRDYTAPFQGATPDLRGEPSQAAAPVEAVPAKATH
jgi:cytochrome c oxidase subunit 4